MIKKVGKLRTLVSFVNNLLINVATVETNNGSIFSEPLIKVRQEKYSHYRVRNLRKIQAQFFREKDKLIK